jgi:predicted DNA-binding transcriptional regulator YafY
MRAGRLVSLLILLQDHGRLSASALARELEVSPRTILRDIEALSGAGVPVFSVRGAAGGFELLGDYGRDLPRITGRTRRGSAGRAAPAVLRLSPRGRRIVAVTERPTGVRVHRRRRASDTDWVEARMPFDSIDSAALDVLALGDEVEVIAPVDLREAVAAIAERVAHRHRVASAGVE